ncbi:MAG: hypothetical protein R3357_13495 [Burkholderiales bacterium]|nr:hypothetical protein [Burkholderiales bacterium]
MSTALRTVAQIALYVPLMALLGFFSTSPRFELIGEDQALVRISLIHAAERKAECRRRTPEELAKLPPNMRAPLECPRERAPLAVELEIDGAVVFSRSVPPTGFSRDGAASLYHRMPVAAGRHRVVARLRDRAEGPFNHVREATLELAPGATLLIDFVAAKGGFDFRGG